MDALEWWLIERKTHEEILAVLREESAARPWAGYFLHDQPLSPGNLNSVCRVGFVPFRVCPQDRYFLVDRSRTPEILAAGGITTEIFWDGDPRRLPAGWQGAVRQAYGDARGEGPKPNTLVALLAFTVPRFRERGMSGRVLSRMCQMARDRGYRYLIVPALPPTQFEGRHVRTPIEQIAVLRRDDGEYYDYWIRLHTRKGAEVIGTYSRSHRFVFSIDDFAANVSSDPIERSGAHVVRMDRDAMLGPGRADMWQEVHADLDRALVTFDWGCVWARYDVDALKP